MRTFSVVRNLFAVIGLVVPLWSLASWGISKFEMFPWVWEEKMRITSPSGSVDVVVFEGNRGAMSSYRYSYFIVRKGERIDPAARSGYDAVLVTSLPAPRPVWTAEHRLSLPYEGGHIFYFQPKHEELNVVAEMPVGEKVGKEY